MLLSCASMLPSPKLEYDEAAHIWHVSRWRPAKRLRHARSSQAAGALHLPAFPKIKNLRISGSARFILRNGTTRLDLRDKRVAVIGTGASAIQLVPAMAAKVKQLDLFQRTPSWILPRMDRAFQPDNQAAVSLRTRFAKVLSQLHLLAARGRAYGFTRQPEADEGRREIGARLSRQRRARSRTAPSPDAELSPSAASACWCPTISTRRCHVPTSNW